MRGETGFEAKRLFATLWSKFGMDFRFMETVIFHSLLGAPGTGTIRLAKDNLKQRLAACNVIKKCYAFPILQISKKFSGTGQVKRKSISKKFFSPKVSDCKRQRIICVSR